jgi:hypothetical protein
MRTIFLFGFAIFFGAALQAQTSPGFHNWALTPPMGWNSWDCFGANVVESEVKANADYMAANLKQYGWEYVVVDIRWFVENQTTGYYNFTNPSYVLDEYGRYFPASNRFPSAANGAGFKPIADYIHSKGLKFGIHIMRGVPVKAVQNNLPIKGTAGLTAADIYSTDMQCVWLPDNYTIVATKPGAQEYYNSIFDLYASWGVDFVKIDDLSRPYHQGEIELIRNAIDHTGRPIVLSMSPGATPIENAEHAQNHANMWRTVDDFWDNWSQLEHEFSVCAQWAPFITPGAFPDADMLPLGHIDLRGNDRQTKFTRDEQYTMMSLFTIFKSPLMFGGHLPDNDDFTNSLITNEEVLYMHKNSVNNRQVYKDNETVAWSADDPASGDKYLALFFVGETGMRTSQALHRTGSVTRATPGYGVDIDVALSGTTSDLYLIVTDCDGSFTNDHADWINPAVYNAQGDSILLTNLTWESATAGWGTVNINKSNSGNTLQVANKQFANGIGTHANSVIHYILPEGYNRRFKAFAGLDKGGTDQNGGATVEFFVFDTDPSPRLVNPSLAVANSGKITRSLRREGVQLEADITGATKLYLVVTDAGDDFNYDHADWINPTISKPDGAVTKLTDLNWTSATSGYATVRKNRSIDNNPLKVNGVTYTNGIGVHSYSYIEYDLPEGYTHFSSFCGFDDEVLNAPESDVSMEFMVFTEEPRLSITSKNIAFDLTTLGFSGEVTVRDLWAKQNLGTFSGSAFAPAINFHGAGLYKLSSATSSVKKKEATNRITVITAGGKQYLKGVERGSEISVFSVEGKLIDRFNAVSELVPLKRNGVSVITVKNKNNISVIKTIG